jgi:2-polyprenyl-6-methoxyphenol hydroxylase-like FAD-dependent oxidoreductase
MDVLISGAGVAGPALAYWLRRAGISPTVVERAPEPRGGGQAVDIRGAAVEVAARTGILDQVRKERTQTRGMSYVSSSGKRLASMNAAFGVIDEADVEIARGDLTRILYEAARDDVEYIFGDSVTGLSEEGDGVRVAFERAPSRSFDLVAGADGLHSAVRAAVFGDEARFMHHLGLYLAVFTVPNEFGLDRWQLVHAGPGKSVTVTSERDGASARAIFFFASPPLSYDHRDLAAQQAIVARAFGREGWEVPRLLAAMPEAGDFYFDSVSQVRMDRWSAGRVVLAGDAAYCPSPLSGQGTSVALVGAYVLAASLAGSFAAGGGYQAAFARYQEVMSDFVAQNQQIAVGNAGRFIPASRRQIWLQNQTIRTLPYLPWKHLVLRAATKGVRQAANAITLPAVPG